MAEVECCVCRSGAQVTLFEAEPTCGGHTLTDSTGQWPVDLGFQVRAATVVTYGLRAVVAVVAACNLEQGLPGLA